MTMTKQPNWKLIANLGDVNPIDYGGFFIYEDTTGVYAPEAEILLEPADEPSDAEEWTVFRFCLEPCTYVNGILSDNKFHPAQPAWFAADLASIASLVGMELDAMIQAFTGDDIVARARAWQAIGFYHGFSNLDSSPHTLTRTEVAARYAHH